MKSESISNSENPQRLIARFEKNRIQAGEDFGSIYSDFPDDMQRTEQLSAEFDSPEGRESMGKVAEGLIFSLMSEGRIGEHFDFRATHLYDDYCNHVDVVVEPKRKALPALATFDITINQEDIKWKERRGLAEEERRPAKLEDKFRQTKAYIDNLARLDPGHARELLGWIQSGGLHERHTPENHAFFKEANRVMLMKYYRTPESSSEPNQPGYVIGGPRSVISVDTVFVNRALQGNAQAQESIRAISFVEFVYGILAEQQYLDALVRVIPHKNLLFDTHYAKVNAWSRILQQPEITDLVGSFLREQQRNQDFNDQFSYYQNTLSKVFPKPR